MNISRLFGKSPFSPLQTHMTKVSLCMEKLAEIIGDLPELNHLSKKVDELCHLEHEADLMKNDIRNHLPRSLFLPMDRAHFLDILSLQDHISDQAEEIGILLKLRPLDTSLDLSDGLVALFKQSFETFLSAKQIIRELDELLESTFGGIEAEKVKAMVEETANKEHHAKLLHRKLIAKLFAKGDHLSPPDFDLWRHLIEHVGMLAVLSEKLANKIRMVLELK